MTTDSTELVYYQLPHGLKNLGSCNFPTNSRKFPTEKIMGAHNLKFAAKFPPRCDFNPKFVCFRENPLTEKQTFPTSVENFSTSKNLRNGGAYFDFCTPQRRH